MSSAPTNDPFDTREYRQGLAEHQERWRRQRWEGIAPEAALWAALTPAWTGSLARRAGFPAADPEAVFRELCCRGLADQFPGRPPRGAPLPVYRLTDPARDEVLGQSPLTPRDLRALAATVAAAVRQAAKREYVPPPVGRWVKLAVDATNGPALVRTFEEEVGESLARTKQTAEAFNWMAAARPLADLFRRDQDPQMDLALQRAGRRLELFLRDQRDRSFLEKYLRRDEQRLAFDELLAEAGGAWALHLLGEGGTGKTMLLRDVSADLAPAAGALTARIDFDYLSPDYPDRTPGLLLWSFAQELRAYDRTSEAARLFNKMDDVLRDLHQRLQAPTATQRRATGHTDFRLAVVHFRDALNELLDAAAPDRPRRYVVLILDTCEELFRSRGGGSPNNLRETVRILEALRFGPDWLRDDPPEQLTGGLARLRVIFAGRLLLAGAGANYQTPEDLDPLSYLRLHELQGFTEGEAGRYLREKEQVPAGYAEAILNRCRYTGAVARILPTTAGQVRWSPYDLQEYADWVREEPRPSVREIQDARGDRYVEVRILQRLGDEALGQALPVLVLAGHFDQRLLAVVCGLADVHGEPLPGSDDRLRELDGRLQALEWLERHEQSTPDGQATRPVWSVAPRLWERLRGYYYPRGRPEGQRRTADYLEWLTLNGDLATLDWTVFNAALAVMEWEEPARVLTWWRGLYGRFPGARGWWWLVKVLEYAIAGRGAVALRPTSGPLASVRVSWLRPLVLETFAGCLRLDRPEDPRLEGTWREVIDTAGAVPDQAAPANLRLRALAGLVVTTRERGWPLTPGLLEPLWQALAAVNPEQIPVEPLTGPVLLEALAAVVAEAEAEDDQGRRRALMGVKADGHHVEREGYGPWLLLGFINRVGWSWQGPAVVPFEALAELMAFHHVLQGRLFHLLGDPQQARMMVEDALGVVSKMKEGGARAEWGYYRLAEDVAPQVMLDCFRVLYPAIVGAEELLNRLRDLPRFRSGRAGDQLASWLVALGLAVKSARRFNPPSESWAQRQLEETVSLYRKAVECREPPSFVTGAEQLASAGQVDAAVGMLRQFLSREDLPTVVLRHGDRALLRLSRRLRLWELLTPGGAGLAESEDPADRALLWSLTVLSADFTFHPPVDVPAMAETVSQRLAFAHAIWRTISLRGEGAAEGTLDWILRNRPHLELALPPDQSPPATYAAAAVCLDLVEMSHLQDEFPHTEWWQAPIPPAFEVLAWAAAHRHLPAEALTLLLRVHALEPFGGEAPAEVEQLARHLGLRRAAELALEEGELLRLRLPRGAMKLLKHAWRWFQACDDWVNVITTGTLLTLARGPAMVRRSARDLDLVRNAYERLRNDLRASKAVEDQWPSWEDLVDNATRFDPTQQAMRNFRLWTPWVKRLALWISQVLPATPRPLKGYLLEHETRRSDYDGGWFADSGPVSPIFFPEPPTPPVLRLVPQSGTAVESFNLTEPIPVTATLLPQGEAVGGSQVTAQWSTPGLAAYAQVPPVEPRLADDLRGLSSPHELVIETAPYLEGPCWEALLSLAAGGRLANPSVFRCRRVTPGATPAPRPGGGFVVRVVSTSTLDQSWARPGWDHLSEVKGLRVAFHSDVTSPAAFSTDGDTVLVLHLIGTATQLRSEMLFRPGDPVSSTMDVNPIAAAQIVESHPRATLCVLQGPPVGPRTSRNDTDRYEALLARMLAARLFAGGFPAVVVIPPLRGTLPQAALLRLAETLAVSAPNTDALLEAVQRLQALVLASPEHAAPAEWAESAHDFCLYAPATWGGLPVP